MRADSWAVLVVVWIPLLVVWLVVLVDVIRRDDLSRRAKALWILVCTLVWPPMIAYLVLRPTRGRLEDAEERQDAHARLVDAVLLHESGGIDDDAMGAIVHGLRTR